MFLFAPVGIALALLVGPARAIVAGAILSLTIEVAQLWVPGRYPSLGDVVFNSAGTATGAILLAAAPGLLRPTRRTAIALCAAWACAVATITGTGLWLLQPLYPDTTYYGQWTPELGSFAVYQGRVLDARVGAVALPSWRLDDSPAARASLAAAPIEVTAVAGPPTADVAPIFSIADGEERQIMMLAADGPQLVYRYHSRASELRFDSPDLRVADALSGIRPGDTLNLSLHPGAGGRSVTLVLNGRVYRRELGVTDLWGLLFAPDGITRRPALRRALGLLWIALLAGPFLLWLPRAFRPTGPRRSTS